MADNDPSILDQFESFLNEKAKADHDASLADDEEIEIWDEKGRGARIRRSRAKPFLQTLGIDMDTDPEEGAGSGDSKDGDAGKGDKKASGRTSKTAPTSVTRKYFTPKK